MIAASEQAREDAWHERRVTEFLARQGRSTKREGRVVVPREALERVHATLQGWCRRAGSGPGTEEHSLLCVVAACLGNWPKVRRVKWAEILRRFERLQQGG